eukprot:scaffold544_cov117-Isochrysis_galbana.AAC.10
MDAAARSCCRSSRKTSFERAPLTRSVPTAQPPGGSGSVLSALVAPPVVRSKTALNGMSCQPPGGAAAAATEEPEDNSGGSAVRRRTRLLAPSNCACASPSTHPSGSPGGSAAAHTPSQATRSRCCAGAAAGSVPAGAAASVAPASAANVACANEEAPEGERRRCLTRQPGCRLALARRGVWRHKRRWLEQQVPCGGVVQPHIDWPIAPCLAEDLHAVGCGRGGDAPGGVLDCEHGRPVRRRHGGKSGDGGDEVGVDQDADTRKPHVQEQCAAGVQRLRLSRQGERVALGCAPPVLAGLLDCGFICKPPACAADEAELRPRRGEIEQPQRADTCRDTHPHTARSHSHVQGEVAQLRARDGRARRRKQRHLHHRDGG